MDEIIVTTAIVVFLICIYYNPMTMSVLKGSAIVVVIIPPKYFINTQAINSIIRYIIKRILNK